MPLLALFSKKNRSSSKVSTTAYSNSNVSLDDDEYVSVTAPTGPISYRAESPASSSKLPLPLRRMREQTPVQSQFQYSDPLLDPPPRRSSIFQTYQDDSNAFGSTRSLPDEAGRPAHPQPLPQQPNTPRLSSAPKKSMFPWSSHKERGKSVSPAKSRTTEVDASFNLKSFRHVRPDSPVLGPPGRRTPSPAPPVAPIPTTALPSPPVAFQVTSRRPRTDSVSELTNSGSSPQTASQQKMAAGAFRQAARRSTTSLSLGDSPVLSPIQTSLDDRPPPSLLPSLAADTQPPRPSTHPPSTTYTPKLVTSPISPISSNFTTSSQSRSAASPSPKPTPVAKPPRARPNAFANTSSSSSSSEEEDEEDESTSDAGVGVGASRISRRRTIKQDRSQPPTLPPLSSSVRQQIQRATPPVSSTSMFENSLVATKDATRPQSALGLGTRPRASLSVGALTPTAKEARASIALAANARLANSSVTPKATPRPLARSPGSDTSESDPGSDSDEDAPLSSLALPRRPGTSHSSHSTQSTTARKPLVDLNAPSTLTGRPVRGPPPLFRDDDGRQKSKVSAEPGTRLRTLQTAAPQRTRNPQAPLSQDSWLSQGTASSNSRTSQAPSARTTTSYETPTTPSFSGSSGRLSSVTPSGGNENRLNTVNKLHLSPVAPPTRPFARRESPASSTGDSSSGKAPLTPRDGSDTRSVYTGGSAMSANIGRPGTHGRKASVTFEDESVGKGKQRDSVATDEARRRDRRRSEARAAIELGNVVNGPPPVDDDDLTLGQQPMGMQGGWPQPGMQMPMQMQIPTVPSMYNMGMAMPSPAAYGMNFPPQGSSADPAFLVAHQQAMAIAKQTFQYAVAQQALAAANEEWERSSTMTGYGGPPAPQWGYGMGMRQSAMFPPAPRSMYAGSINGGAGGWGGTGSVYGNAFGPGAAGGRTSTYSLADSGAQRPVRPRTKTAPSAASPPAGTPGGRVPVPPSSYRAPGR